MFFDVSRREQLSGQRKSLRKVLEARAAMRCKIPIFLCGGLQLLNNKKLTHPESAQKSPPLAGVSSTAAGRNGYLSLHDA
jgi:hypothetical protein